MFRISQLFGELRILNDDDPPAGGGAGGGGGDKTFTQAELDRIVEERLARDRRSRQPEKPADYDELKQKAEELDQLRAEGQSELDRERAAKEKAERDLQEATQRASAADERAQTALRNAAVMAEASKQGAVDPEAVIALLPKDSVTIGDDGQVTGAEQAVKGLLEQRKWLVGETPDPGPGDGGARPPAPGAVTRDQLAQMSPKEIAALDPKVVDKALAEA